MKNYKNYNSNAPIYELYIHRQEHGFGTLRDCRNYIIIVKQKGVKEPHAYVRAPEPSLYNQFYSEEDNKTNKVYKVGSLRLIEHKLKWDYVFRGYITKEKMEEMLFIDML